MLSIIVNEERVWYAIDKGLEWICPTPSKQITTFQAKSTKPYAYIIHLHQTLSTSQAFSKPALSLAKETLQDRHRIQLDKLEMYCKYRMKLKMFKSKKMQLGRGKHTGSTWVHGKYIKKGTESTEVKNIRLLPRRYEQGWLLAGTEFARNPKYSFHFIEIWSVFSWIT